MDDTIDDESFIMPDKSIEIDPIESRRFQRDRSLAAAAAAVIVVVFFCSIVSLIENSSPNLFVRRVNSSGSLFCLLYSR
jgi:hypothetical protein